MKRSIAAISGVCDCAETSTSSGPAVCPALSPCTLRRWIERPGSRASEARHGCAVRPRAGSHGSFAWLAPVGPYRSADALPCSGTSIASSCETRPDASHERLGSIELDEDPPIEIGQTNPAPALAAQHEQLVPQDRNSRPQAARSIYTARSRWPESTRGARSSD